MKRVSKALGLFAVALSCSEAFAYELTTHGWITLKAYERSTLSPANSRSIQPVLGFDRLSLDRPFVAPFGNELEASRYYDNAPVPGVPLDGSLASLIHERKLQKHERRIISDLVDGGFLVGVTRVEDAERRIEGWLIRGAVREDDAGFKFLGVDTHLSQPRDHDPHGEYLRAFGCSGLMISDTSIGTFQANRG
jgi:hypothetical protein